MTAGDALLIEPLTTADGGRLMRVCLNAPRALNALNTPMMETLLAALDTWRDDPSVVGVFLEGAGERAFCAGGDVVSAARDMVQHPPGEPCPEAERFFRLEYWLDHTLHTYPKPVVAWGDGIVMGGGTGLLAAASHPVVTPRTRLSMPEMPLGLFPDVGSSFFLQRLPGRTGYYLGLTGEAVGGADLLGLGLARYLAADEAREAAVEALVAARWGDGPPTWHEAASRALGGVWPQTEVVDPTPFMDRFPAIQAVTDHAGVAAVLAAVARAAEDDPEFRPAAERLPAGCPVSQAIFHRAWEAGRHDSLADCFRREVVMAIQCCRRPDFREGVRAVLIDKDRRPHWSVPDLDSLDPQVVDAHFRLPDDYAANPLAELGSQGAVG